VHGVGVLNHESDLMDVEKAASMLAAIGHSARLRVYRVLIEAGPSGRAAGELAHTLDIAPSSLSFHLKELVHAGLIQSRQHGRFVIYSVIFESMSELMLFLAKDCCEGNPCLPVNFSPAEAVNSIDCEGCGEPQPTK